MTPDSSLEDSLFGVVLQDSYKITGMLGQGGMGAVYDALQIRLNKRVAIKVMARELATNSEALNRFHREAMITSGLGHPHIVQVFDFSTTPSGQPFLAMEFLDGEDLDRRIARVGRLPIQQTVHIVKQVASALSATHAQEIVHRDLKPANIYLLKVAGEDDFVKVLDFGISKIRAASTKITKASALIGTPDYMSPEQAMGSSDDVDDRTDQWALACIAWECLSGNAPFSADSVPAMLFQVVHGEPAPLANRVGGLPQDVEPVLRRALAKQKDERFANVVEFAQALEAAVQGKTAEQVAVQAVPEPRTETATYESTPGEDRTERPTTTFGHAAGETKSDEDQPRATRPKWHWGVAGAGAVALSLIAFLALRPTPASKRPSAHAALPAPAAEAPAPAAAAMPAAAPVAATPAPAATVPTVAAPAPTAEPTPSAVARVEGEAKAGTAEAAADSKLPASADVASKPRTKKAMPAVRAKAKSPAPERRLIKEL